MSRISARGVGYVVKLSCLAGLVVSLTACQTLRETLSGDNAVDYKSVVRTDPLSIPPDLTQAASDPRYRAPATGVTTYSQYETRKAEQKGSSGLTQVAVLPDYPGIEVKRDGLRRWLVVSESAEALFPKVEEFWYQNGFNLEVIDPKAGLMVTNWAENRAKIPESWMRQLLGTLIDQVYDSGQRDKFRTVFERDGDKTIIYISHQTMVETRYGIEADQVRWEWGKEDPGLNAAMLARLMVYLGETDEEARRKMAQAKAEEPARASVVDQIEAQGQLTIDEGFDQSWRRIGMALDAGNFAVEDRDRSTGDYYVRYVDTDTGEKRETPSFFARLFGAKAPAPAEVFRINLTSEGDRTVVKVYDSNGQLDTSPTAKRLLEVLAERL